VGGDCGLAGGLIGCLRGSGLAPEKAGLTGAKPDAGVWGLGDGEDDGVGGEGNAFLPGCGDVHHAVNDACGEHAAGGGAADGGEAKLALLGGGDGGESAVGVAEEPGALQLDPEGARGVDDQREDVVDGRERWVGGVDGRKANAVEAEEAAFRADPEVTVGGLGEGVDLAAGQTLLGGPAAFEILAEDAAGLGVEAEGGEVEGKEGEDGQIDGLPSMGRWE